MKTTKTAVAVVLAALVCAQRARAQDTSRPDASKPQTVTDEASPDWTKNGGCADASANDCGTSLSLGFPIKFSGYFWNDTGYLIRNNAQSGQPDQQAAYMTGRYVLRANYGRSFGDVSAVARVEFLGLVNEFTKSAYEPHTLDAYVKIGTKNWDVQIGRFLAWEVYYRGQGIELYTAEEAGALGAPTHYLLDYTRGLLNEPGQAAVHWFPTEWLSLELSSVFGQSSSNNYYGGRPAFDIQWKGLRFIAGAEILRQAPQTSADKLDVTSKGYAARLQYTPSPLVTFGVVAAKTAVDFTGSDGLIDTSKTYDKTSVGGFVDLYYGPMSVGLGYHHTSQIDQRHQHDTHNQAFVSVQYRTPIDGLSVKGVYGYSRAHLEDIDANSQWENYLNSFRLRLLYEFH